MNNLVVADNFAGYDKTNIVKSAFYVICFPFLFYMMLLVEQQPKNINLILINN